MEWQSEPNRAHQGFREQTALAAHVRQRRHQRHGNMTWHDMTPKPIRINVFLCIQGTNQLPMHNQLTNIDQNLDSLWQVIIQTKTNSLQNFHSISDSPKGKKIKYYLVKNDSSLTSWQEKQGSSSECSKEPVYDYVTKFAQNIISSSRQKWKTHG